MVLILRITTLITGRNVTRDVFYVRREVDLMKTAKVNAYIMHIFGKIELLLYMQPKIISNCVTLMSSKRQRHTYLLTDFNYATLTSPYIFQKTV